ncbi:MAG: InlB B-repeat-containing protein, partial [Lachnospiraceae bacterium]|nr:InlB B-repeat-containing protein [Lachnospiraceae bacterium]
MRKHRYRVKAKRLIAGLIATITILNPLLESSAGVIQTIAAEEVLTAEGEKQLITVKLNEMNAVNSVKEKEVITGETYGTLPTPIREGYIFEGWYTEKSEGIHITETTEVQADISELFAHWKPIEIKVDLYGFGVDDLASKSITVVYGHTFANLPLLEKEGYIFEGWFTSPNGETQISNQSQVTATSPIALYARWSGKKVTVSFDETEAIVNPASITVDVGDVYGSLPVPERAGYDFCGWFLDEVGATEITADTLVSTQKDHVLYAGWKEQEHKIVLDAQGGKCGTSAIEVKVGEKYGELPVASYDGHVFLGWYDGMGEDANRITSETIVSTNALKTLYAKWRSNNYTVTLVSLMDGVENSAIEVTYGNAYEKLPWLSKKNYTFLGWYTKAADGTKIENKDIVEITSDQTLYAQWEGNKYIVTFDAVGGTVSTEEKEVVYGTAYGKLPTPTKKGYIFDGWYTSTAGKTLITEDDKVTLTGNQTLYAHWTPREAAIKLSANGGQMVYNGECVESCTLNKEYDEYYEELPVPWREGYTFLGWYTAKTAGEEITNVSRVEFTTDTVLYARWSGNNYTVTFDARGGSVAQKSIQVTTGEDYGELPVPEKKNYVFKGWYTALEDGSKILSTTNSKLTGDQTLYALYEGVKIKLTYNANGGSCAKQSATVYYGDVIDSLPTPTNAGYVFKGWYTANKTKVEEGDTITFSEDTTLYAHWQETTYTITFNPNGGLVSSTEKEVKHGQSYGSLPRATRDGYAFLGWFTSKTGSTQIFGSDIVNLSADDTLYAHWSPYTYTVTFNMNGGTATVYEKDVTFGGSYGTLPTPKRSGYTFAGWYTKSRYGSKVTATSNVEIDSDHTLYAQWTSQIFVITFKPNGGTVDVTNVAVPVGTSYSSFPVPEREGYNFAGWYTSASGGTRITSLSVKDILYAHWTGKNYTVYFDAVDGTVSQTSKKVVYADTYGTLPTPTKSGMEFAGWYTAKTGGTKVTKTTSMKTAGNHTLYAHWKGISSKLSYDSNGGKAITSTKTVTFGEKYGTLSTPTRTGYTFLGWYTSPTGGKKITSDTIVATTVNQTVYAHWEPKKIAIRFSANNGRVVVNGYKVAIEERIYTYGQTFGDFPDPQREGYKFLGWYTTTSTAGTKMTEGEICNLTADETLYACWSGIQNKVLFDANGGEVDTGEKTVTYGGTYGTLPTPVREGYSFKGWYDRKIGGTKVISTTTVELLAAQTLYARWEVEEFRLTLDGNGGGYSVTNASGESSWLTSRSMSIPYGCNYVGKETNFGTFSRKGYYFNGFFTEPEGGTQVTIATEFLHDTKQTIYAQWVPLKINVLYETGKADDVYQCSKLTYGSEYGEFPTVSRTGYSLDGWSIDGKSTLIDETTSVGTAKAHSLTAKWTANQYVLHYDANGGSVDEASKTVTYGAGIGTLEKPTRTGYKFEGWYTQRTGGYEISASDTYLKAENMTVFAHWSKTGNQIILFYKPNGGKCTESSKTVYPGYIYGELAEAQREGYVFTGWYKNSQGTGLVTEGDTVTDTKNISLYAGWDAKESNVFFDSTGGSVGISVKTVSYGETYGELPVPTKDYYTFSGWYTQPEGGTKILESSKVNISDTTILYAQWTPMPYEVYFDANGGTVDVKQKTVAYEQEYGELPVPLYEGMDFIGWYTDKENGYCVKKETLVQIAQNHTLYARWEGSFTTVKFDANGGKAEESEKTIVSGTEVGTIPTAERRGYELTGWYTLPDGGEFVSETYIVSGEEVTFYAQWKPLEIVVTFDAQDGTVQNAEKQVLFGEAYGELPDAVLPGYQFVGWYLEKEGQTKIEKETIVDVENNHTLFAYYVKKDDIPQAEIQEFYFGEEGANPASGNISFSVTDMVMNIPGLEQELVRTYNSKDRVPKSMGKGWTFGFEASYELYADGAIIYLPNGSVDVFTLTEDGYVGNNNHNKLQVNEDGSAVLMQKDQVKYGFQNDGRLAYIEDRNGNRTKVSYTNGMISELCDPVGRVYTITANLDGLITEITDPMGGKIIYAYDENNLLTHVTNLLGGVTTYEYDKNGYLYRIIDPNDNVIQEFEYVDSVALDGAEISRSMDAYGGITEYAYYEEDNYTVITDESDRKWTYWYDSNMRVTAVQNPDGSMYTTEYVEYEEGIHHADVKSTTDEYGSRNQYEYDANGNIIKATYADGSTEEFLYDELNNLLMKKSETGEHTYFCYDKDGINLLKQVQKTNGGEIKLTPENAYEVLAGITAKDGGYIVTEFDYYTKDEAKGMFDCNLSGLLESETNAEGESFVYTYDQYGNTATETDIAGNTKQYTYDMLGHKLSEVTPNGDEFKWSYLPNGYATREYYPDGGVVVSQYDAAGHLTQTVSQELYEAEKDYGNLYKGKTGTFYEYNPSGRLGSITNALGNKVQYTYDCSGNLIKEEVEGAEVYSYEYDERDRLIKQWYQETAKEPKVLLKEAAYEVLEDGGYQVKTTYYADSETGVTQVTVYDEKGREKEEYILAGDEKLEHTQYTYFADNKVASVQNGDYSTYYQYNVLGNVTQLLEPVEQESGEVLYRKTVYEYDRAGRMIKELVYHAPVVRDSISLFMETPETDTTVYYYEDGLLVKETNPNGVSTHYSYDADGNVIQILVGDGTPEDGTARKITQGFDFRKNMIYQTQYVNAEDLEGRTTASGNLVALTTTYAYDKEGRLAEETAPDGIKTVYEYDAVGNQISLQKPVLDAAGNTIGEYRVSAEYDAKGQMVSFTDALGNVTRYSYDNRGNLLCTEDALGGTSLTEYNYNNQKVLEVSPANYLDGQAPEKMSHTEYMYDNAGRLVEITDYTMENGTLVNKAVQSHEYNADGHVIRSTDAEGHTTEFGYTPAGQQAYEIAANGNKTEYGYDVYGQLSKIDNGINQVYYSYDFSGNLLEAGDEYGTMERFTYDMFGNAVTYTDGNGNQTRYTYNAFGEVASAALPEDETIGGLTTYYRYDTMGRVKTVYDTEGSTTRYAYDSMGNVTQVEMEDPETGKKITAFAEYDVNSQEVMRMDAAGLRTESKYDALGRLVEQKTYSSTEQGRQKTVSYTYDAGGNLLSETDWLGNTIRKEYDAWNRLTAEYDALGNLIGAYTYDKIGNQTSVTDAMGNTTRYEYDEAGKLKILTEATGAESRYTYDAGGNITSITDALGYSHQYSYDGRNRLVSATIPTGDTVEYTYDNNDNLLVQKDGNGNRTVYEYNVRNLEISRQDAAEDAPNLTAPKETRRYHADGSLLEVVDRNGVSTTYRYDA